jgi:hypothetical protein
MTGNQPVAGHVEEALIIVIPLSRAEGTREENRRLFQLEDELIKTIESAGAGEYDGNEIGEETFTMYAYGPSADKLFDAVIPVLAQHHLPPGSQVVKRYGKPGAREDRVRIENKFVN